MSEGGADADTVATALDYVDQVATVDVRETITWLLSKGWDVKNVRGGRSESFGNVLVTFARGRDEVTIARDRSQWLLNMWHPGWHHDIDFQVIAEAVTGEPDPWTGGALPSQVPSGISWRDTLPIALDWVSSTPNAERTLHALQQKRGRELLGPTNAKGTTQRP